MTLSLNGHPTLGVWVKGCLAAVVGGVGNAFVVARVDKDPTHYSLFTTLGRGALLEVAVYGAVWAVVFYLWKSPLPRFEPCHHPDAPPPWDGVTERRVEDPLAVKAVVAPPSPRVGLGPATLGTPQRPLDPQDD